MTAMDRLRSYLTPEESSALDRVVRRYGAVRVFSALALCASERDVRRLLVRQWLRAGMSYRRAGEILGCSHSTVRTAAAKAAAPKLRRFA